MTIFPAIFLVVRIQRLEQRPSLRSFWNVLDFLITRTRNPTGTLLLAIFAVFYYLPTSFVEGKLVVQPSGNFIWIFTKCVKKQKTEVFQWSCFPLVFAEEHVVIVVYIQSKHFSHFYHHLLIICVFMIHTFFLGSKSPKKCVSTVFNSSQKLMKGSFFLIIDDPELLLFFNFVNTKCDTISEVRAKDEKSVHELFIHTIKAFPNKW